jgi:hypothetical protein
MACVCVVLCGGVWWRVLVWCGSRQPWRSAVRPGSWEQGAREGRWRPPPSSPLPGAPTLPPRSMSSRSSSPMCLQCTTCVHSSRSSSLNCTVSSSATGLPSTSMITSFTWGEVVVVVVVAVVVVAAAVVVVVVRARRGELGLCWWHWWWWRWRDKGSPRPLQLLRTTPGWACACGTLAALPAVQAARISARKPRRRTCRQLRASDSWSILTMAQPERPSGTCAGGQAHSGSACGLCMSHTSRLLADS